MKSVIASVALLATMASPALGDPAQTPGSNIEISECQAQAGKPPAAVTQSVNSQGQPTSTTTETLGGSNGPSLTIAYTNTAAVAAKEIDFAFVGEHGLIQAVSDTGNITSGSPIRRKFDLTMPSFPLGASGASCTVTKVVYANGTTWANPAPPQ